MFKIQFKFLFIYNVVFNSIGFCLIFPFELDGAPLYLDDLAPPDVPALVKRADDLYENYQRVEPVIKDSSSWRRKWELAEYELEEARVNRMARAAAMSPAEVQHERQQGKGWAEICGERMLALQRPDVPEKAGWAGLALDGPYEHVRVNSWFLWRCYYSPASYANRRLKWELAHYNYSRGEGEFPFEQADYRGLLLGGGGRSAVEEGYVEPFKGKMVPPRLIALEGQQLDLSFFCAEYYQVRATVAISGNLRRVCGDGAESGVEQHGANPPLLPGRLLGYKILAGSGKGFGAKIERNQALPRLRNLLAPPTARLNLCQ